MEKILKLKIKLKEEIESYNKCNKTLEITTKKIDDEILRLKIKIEKNKLCFDFTEFIQNEENKQIREKKLPLIEKLDSHKKDIYITAKKLEELIGLEKLIDFCSEGTKMQRKHANVVKTCEF